MTPNADDFLFSKYLPVVNMAEIKAVIKTTSEKLPKSVGGVSKREKELQKN